MSKPPKSKIPVKNQCKRCNGTGKVFSAGGDDLSGDWYKCSYCQGDGYAVVEFVGVRLENRVLAKLESKTRREELYEKYSYFFAVNARVQCPQITCEQAAEVAELLTLLKK